MPSPGLCDCFETSRVLGVGTPKLCVRGFSFVHISIASLVWNWFKSYQSFHSSLFDVMASDDLDIPQIAVVGVPEDNNNATTQTLPSSSSPSSLDHGTLPTDNQEFSSLPTPNLDSELNSLDAVGSPSPHSDIGMSESSLQPIEPPPSPTLSAHSSGPIVFVTSMILRDNDPEEHGDGLSSLKLLAGLLCHHRRNGAVTSSVGSSLTEREYEDNQSFMPSPVRSRAAHPDVASTLPSPTHTNVVVVSEVPSRSSSPASFLRTKLNRFRRSSPSPSVETDTGLDTVRGDGQGDNLNVKRKGPGLTCGPAVSDLTQEADFENHAFTFKQLASLVDTKSLEPPDGMGGVHAIFRGLGAQPTYGLSTELGPPPSHAISPDLISQDFMKPHASHKDLPKPNTMANAGVSHGFQSTASLTGCSASGVILPIAFQISEGLYSLRTSIKDRKRIFGQNIVPQHPSKTLLQLMWFKDNLLVR